MENKLHKMAIALADLGLTLDDIDEILNAEDDEDTEDDDIDENEFAEFDFADLLDSRQDIEIVLDKLQTMRALETGLQEQSRIKTNLLGEQK